MGEFRMPSLGADMDEGTLLEWLVKPGEAVHRGDLMAVVDTDKATIEVEVFEDGVVQSLLVEPGARVPVGTPLAVLGAGGAAPVPPPSPVAPPPAAAPPAAAPPVPVAAPAPPRAPSPRPPVGSPLPRRRAKQRAAGGRVRSSPLARRRAAALGLDLASVAGSGPGGAVLARDLPAARAAPAAAAGPVAAREPVVRADKAAAMRRAIGELMARSKREIPHYYLSTTVDLTRAVAWLRDANAGRPVAQRLVPAALLLKAAALAARTVPDVNGFWVDGHFEPAAAVHVGVAVALRPSGLVAPAILDADGLDLETLMSRLADLVARARTGRLRQSEMSAPTITVTNLGDQGVESVFGVIYPPQVALVGFGRVVERPWAVDGLLGVRPVVTATLAGDHRASDGHRGGRYLSAVDDLLQKPEEL